MDRKGRSVTTMMRDGTVLCLVAVWAMGGMAGIASAQVCPPDECPLGSALVDGEGDFSGWCVSGNLGVGLAVNAIDVDLATGVATIEVAKTFDQPPGFGNMFGAILIDFVQACPDGETVTELQILEEAIVNETGYDWDDFHWILFDTTEAWFDVAASTDFDTSPLSDKTFSEMLAPGKAKRLDVAGGSVPTGTTYTPGGDGGELVIDVDLSATIPVSFALKERPTCGPLEFTCPDDLVLECDNREGPNVNSAVIETRIFNDDPDSNVTFANNYPDSIVIQDANLDGDGQGSEFANLHIWRYSENSFNPALFNNDAGFVSSADLVLDGSGDMEGGLQVAPWWSQQVDGRFNVRTTDGEIACFGGRLPFYSFTGSQGVTYTKGDLIRLAIVYRPNNLTESDPGTIEYLLSYLGSDYTSGELAFSEGNPAEDPPYGLWGILNNAQVGGYIQAFIEVGNPANMARAEWSNIVYTGLSNAEQIAEWLASAMATGGCGADVVNDFNGLSDGCGDTGSATVIFVATSNTGESETCTATITVVDTTPPAINCPDDITIECGEEATYVELIPTDIVKDGSGGTSHWTHVIDGDTSYHTINLSNAPSIVKVENISGAQTSSELYTANDWFLASGETSMANGQGFGISNGTHLMWTDTKTDAIWKGALDGTGITSYVTKAAIMAYTGEGNAASGNGNVIAPDGEFVWFESTSDSLLMTTGVDMMMTLAIEEELMELLGQVDGSVSIVSGMTYDPADTLYFGASTDDSGSGQRPGGLYKREADGTLGVALTAAQITAVSGEPAGRVGFGDIFYAPDGYIYFYESREDNIMRFDPTNPGATIAMYLTEDQLLSGPMGSDNVVSMGWHDGALTFHTFKINSNTAVSPLYKATTVLAQWLDEATASDTCGDVTVDRVEETVNGCGGTGTTVYTWTATDECGNTSSCSATFTVVDNTPPTLNCPADLEVECDGAGNMDELNAWLNSASASDACGTVTLTNDFNGLSDDCGATGSATVTWTATDECDNTSTCTATFTIVDRTPPAISCPMDLTVECGDSDAFEAWLASATASDVCGGVTLVNDFSNLNNGGFEMPDASAGDTGPIAGWGEFGAAGTRFVTQSVPAQSGLQSLKMFGPFDVLGGGTGVVQAMSAAPGETWIAEVYSRNDSNDPIGAGNFAAMKIEFLDAGFNLAAGGLAGVDIFEVIVADENTPQDIWQFNGVGTAPAPANTAYAQIVLVHVQAGAGITGGAVFLDDARLRLAPDGCGPDSATTVTWTATDDCGNTSSCSASFTVIDRVPPTIECPPDLTVECDGMGNVDELAAWLASASASDNCGEVTLTDDFNGLSDDCGATGSATVTWTATDECGNTATCTATFTIVDTLPPEVMCSSRPAKDCCENGDLVALSMVYTGDDCSATDHSQDPGKVACMGDPMMEPLVIIRASDKSDPNDGGAKVWFEGQVGLDEEFTLTAANAGESKLKSETWLHIFDLDGNLLQTVKFHTSCSQPIFEGNQFGAARVTGCIGDDEPIPGDCCDNGGKIQILTMEYTGDDCSVMSNSQDPSKVSCDGDPMMAPNVIIRASNKENPNDGGARVWFEGPVALNGTYDIDANNASQSKLETVTWVHVFDLDGNLLQTIEFHTSCSQPVAVGDQFASALVVDCVPEDRLAAAVVVTGSLTYDRRATTGEHVLVGLVGRTPASDPLLTTVIIDFEATDMCSEMVDVMAVLQTNCDTTPIDPGKTVTLACPSGPTDDCCENGSPRVLTMRYTGQDCDATLTDQDPDKVECDGDPMFAPMVLIRASDKEDPNDGGAKVWFEGQVDLNDTYDIDAANAGEDKLKSSTYIHVFDLDGNLLQTIEFHTSCSQPLTIGDQFGSARLIDCIGEDEPIPGDCCANGDLRSLTLRYTGDGCDQTSNSQDPDKVSCDGDPDNEMMVNIRASDKENPFDGGAKVWFEGMVVLDGTFVADAANAGEDKLKSATWIHVFDMGGNLLQTVEFHTSCSQPLAAGDQFGSIVVEDCSDTSQPSTGDCCENGDLRILTMEYTGEDCTASSTTQNPDKWSCDGDPAMAPMVNIRASDDEDPNDSGANVWFEGTVALNDTFDIDAANAGEDKLKNQTFIHIFDLDDNLLQTLEFHTSCSQDLFAGDQFGSALLLDCVGTDEPDCEIEYARVIVTAVDECGNTATCVTDLCPSFICDADLDGDQEVPPVVSAASGTAAVQLSGDELYLEYSLDLTGVDLDGNQTPDPLDDVVGVHIHNAGTGMNGPVVLGIINPAQDVDAMVDPVSGHIQGRWDAGDPSNAPLADMVNPLIAGELYFNIHTVGNPSGEIRGQIDCEASVPVLEDDGPDIVVPRTRTPAPTATLAPAASLTRTR